MFFTNIQNICWGGGEGVQGQFMFCPKFKNDNIISAKSSFYCFIIRMLLGGGRGFARIVHFVKWMTP